MKFLVIILSALLTASCSDQNSSSTEVELEAILKELENITEELENDASEFSQDYNFDGVPDVYFEKSEFDKNLIHHLPNHYINGADGYRKDDGTIGRRAKQRSDDNINVIKTRLDNFIEETYPVSKFFSENYSQNFFTIDASQEVSKIQKELINITKKGQK